jgi:hypothetical protein
MTDQSQPLTVDLVVRSGAGWLRDLRCPPRAGKCAIRCASCPQRIVGTDFSSMACSARPGSRCGCSMALFSPQLADRYTDVPLTTVPDCRGGSLSQAVLPDHRLRCPVSRDPRRHDRWRQSTASLPLHREDGTLSVRSASWAEPTTFDGSWRAHSTPSRPVHRTGAPSATTPNTNHRQLHRSPAGTFLRWPESSYSLSPSG